MWARRLEIGLTQMKLADRVCNFTFIGRLESAESNVSLDSMVRIAKGVNCKVVELLRGDNWRRPVSRAAWPFFVAGDMQIFACALVPR